MTQICIRTRTTRLNHKIFAAFEGGGPISAHILIQTVLVAIAF